MSDRKAKLAATGSSAGRTRPRQGYRQVMGKGAITSMCAGPKTPGLLFPLRPSVHGERKGHARKNRVDFAGNHRPFGHAWYAVLE